jgi:hypothetical protein
VSPAHRHPRERPPLATPHVLCRPLTVAAVLADDDLHGKEAIDLSTAVHEGVEEYQRSREYVRRAVFGGDVEGVSSNGSCVENRLYDELGVPTDASPEQVGVASGRAVCFGPCAIYTVLPHPLAVVLWLWGV